MLNNANWRNIPNSYESIKHDGKNKIGIILNYLDNHTKNTPSKIRSRKDLVKALRKINWSGNTTLYDHFNQFIKENIGFEHDDLEESDEEEVQPVVVKQQPMEEEVAP
eukprot:CAMPEP_0201569582 /NCGR_PEP_ID=MMETSP0190_2-20130828/11353_1 /ASSEMBLY_ACC=CAM_ASM_000263 /TAXON_ID=37353 /ORGANISM="Rosalina sp." /LENGTH=107 /DNA_ID=CAMNT_0047992061 /DNA_START=118 /DNA_END=438 /DNA_ORIENTATION=+